MSNVGREGRSYVSIETEDLKRLTEIAIQDRQAFFVTHPQWARLYGDRVLGIVLCQGAALHYVDGITGINDFDVYTFFEMNPVRGIYAKRIKSYDFGDPKFGQSVDKPGFIGRRVDCMFRSIEHHPGETAESAIQRFVLEGRTETARLLSLKAMVLLEPNCGRIIWSAKNNGSQR